MVNLSVLQKNIDNTIAQLNVMGISKVSLVMSYQDLGFDNVKGSRADLIRDCLMAQGFKNVYFDSGTRHVRATVAYYDTATFRRNIYG